MYQRIRTALTTEGLRVNSANIFLGSAVECYYCPSFYNPQQKTRSKIEGYWAQQTPLGDNQTSSASL